MEPVDRTPVLCPQSHHATIARSRRLAVVGTAYPERVLPRSLLFVQPPAYPPCPAGLAFARCVAAPVPEHAKGGIIETRGAFQVVRPQTDVGEHGHESPAEYRHSSRAGAATPVTYSFTERSPSLS